MVEPASDRTLRNRQKSFCANCVTEDWSKSGAHNVKFSLDVTYETIEVTVQLWKDREKRDFKSFKNALKFFMSNLMEILLYHNSTNRCEFMHSLFQ